MKDNNKLVLRLKEVMVQKGISREDLADKVKVSVTTISNINTESSLPTIKLLLKIAKALDIDVRELFIPTKADVVIQSDVNEATVLINKALEVLQGKKHK